MGKMRLGKPLTWDQVADIYDKNFTGRRARTCSMDYIFDKVKSLDHVHLNEEEGTLHLLYDERDDDEFADYIDWGK